MCGIVGVINKTGQDVDFRVLSRMARTLNHRGPDDEGHMIDGPIGFYHKRLSIIDLETGLQPMSSGPLTIVFNGEIYNYLELRITLKKLGHVFKTRSDTEVILHLYEEFGLDFIHQLNGMFAFLIYDRSKKRLIAARDHFGIKPLYYFVDNSHLIFASEIKALLAHPAVDAVPDFKSIQQYMALQYTLGDRTLFKAVKKIIPGYIHVIDLETFKTEIHRYWNLDFTVDTHHTEEYFIYRLRKLLEESVRIQMRSDVPVGTYLSGGMDSSLVTILAAGFSPDRIKTFTGAFKEGKSFDETGYARAASTACNAMISEIYPGEDEFIELLPKLIFYMDEPTAGPGLFPQYMVAQLAAQNVKVVLGGQGGDEIFGGYTRYLIAYFEQAIKGAIFESNDEGEHIVSLKSILPNLSAAKQYVPLLKQFWHQGVFEPMDRRYFQLINRAGTNNTYLSHEFQNRFRNDDVFHEFQEVFQDPNTKSYFNKMVNYDLRTNLPSLLHVEDRVSMAVSLESRVPLLDHRIVELITSMPPGMKFKGAELKYILKKAVRDLLPDKILNRKDKMGFPVPLHIWAQNKAKTFFQDVLLSDTCRNRGLFNVNEIERLIENETSFGRKLWGLLNLELWFKQFID